MQRAFPRVTAGREWVGNAVTLPVDLQAVIDWQVEDVARAGEVLASEDFTELPDKFEIHEYSIMEQYCLGVADARLRDTLCDAIR